MIDGLELPAHFLSALKPESIKGIEVLKGKEALERYGKKGSNGVVLISLKSEKELEVEKGTVDEKVASLMK